MEKLLIEKSIQGDVTSFETLIRRYDRYVYNIAYRMLGNEEDAKDAAQEAMIKAYRNIANFRAESAFSTWLYRITINVCKDELKKRRDAVLYYEDPDGDAKNVVEHLVSDERDPLIIYEQNELKRQLMEAMKELSPEHREVLVRKDVLDESYEAIAHAIEVPIGTVRSRLNRARLTLRGKMQERMAR
ncbi:MAG: sigma-70 family RNA polymerase sigma factor [Bacillota bacterium]|nr:sigma-70 family RNA polymerase sigma factor [Bacillota bacterium]